jgi:hypothetical protein
VPQSAIKPSGGARRDRTDDLMLAKHALSQLSYGPVTRRRMLHSGLRAAFPSKENALDQMVGLGRLELPTSRLSSARSNQLSYKPLTLILNRKDRVLLAQPASNAGCVAQAALSPSGSVFVREERETKTAKSRQWSSTIPRLLAPDVSKTIR